MDTAALGLLVWQRSKYKAQSTRRMYPAGNLLIPVPHGQLEAILKEPSVTPAKGVALVLHPHPLGGGTMHNKVVFRAAAALNDAGLTSLRINFRGVGQSTGTHDFGKGELDDVRAGFDYLAEHYPNQSITVCGFSFGALMGLGAGCEDQRVKQLISIGTPLSKYSFGFLTKCSKPLLFVHGELDEFGDVNAVRKLVEQLKQHTSAELVVMPGAGHFFDNSLEQLKSAITSWITANLG